MAANAAAFLYHHRQRCTVLMRETRSRDRTLTKAEDEAKRQRELQARIEALAGTRRCRLARLHAGRTRSRRLSHVVARHENALCVAQCARRR